MEFSQTWVLRFFRMAQSIAAWSKDPSTQVGAVIVDDQKRIVSVGYNGFARGVSDDDSRYQDRSVKYEMVVHGEVNAILSSRTSVVGCSLFTWPLPPCSRCAALVIQSGIKQIHIPPDWVMWPKKRQTKVWQDSWDLARTQFREAKIPVYQFTQKIPKEPNF